MASVDVIIRTVDQGSQGAVSFAKKLGNAWKELATPINQTIELFGKVQDVASQAVEAIGTGADVAQVTASFEQMNEEIFKTPDLLDQMKEASRGTISEMQLMSGLMTLTAGASTELSQAYAEAAPQLLEMAKAANKLNPALGSTEFLYESMATGIKRASPLILDNLGIVVKQGEAYENYAETLGKTSSELTNAEKQYAFLNEAMKAGNVLIEQAGGSVDALGDPLARVNTLLEDTKNNFLAAFATEVVGGIDDVAGGFGDMSQDVEELGRVMGELATVVLPLIVEGATAAAEGIGKAAKSINFTNQIEELQQLGIITEEQAREATIAYRDLGQDAGIAMLEGWEEEFYRGRKRMAENAVGSLDEEMLAEIEQYDDLFVRWMQNQESPEAEAEEAGREAAAGFVQGFEDLSYDFDGSRILEGIRNAEEYAEIGRDILDQADMDAAFAEEAEKIAESFWDSYQSALEQRMAQSGDFFIEAMNTDFFGAIDNVKDLYEEDDFDLGEMFTGMVDDADASAAAIAGVAVALGDMTEAEANAVLQGAFLLESLQNIAQQIADGIIDPEAGVEMATQLWEDFRAGVDIISRESVVTATPYVDIDPDFVQGDDIQSALENAFAVEGGQDIGDAIQAFFEGDGDIVASPIIEFEPEADAYASIEEWYNGARPGDEIQAALEAAFTEPIVFSPKLDLQPEIEGDFESEMNAWFNENKDTQISAGFAADDFTVPVAVEPILDETAFAAVSGELSAAIEGMTDEETQIVLEAIADEAAINTTLDGVAGMITGMPLVDRQVIVEADSGPAEEAISSLIGGPIAELIALAPTVIVNADTDAAISGLNSVKAAADAIPRNINIKVTVEEETIEVPAEATE